MAAKATEPCIYLDGFALLGQNDLLSDGQVVRIKRKIAGQNLTGGGTAGLGKIVKGITGLDDVGRSRALCVCADRNVQKLVDLNDVVVSDLSVGGFKTVKGDVEVLGDGGEGVVFADKISVGSAGGTGVGGGDSGAGSIVRSADAGGNGEDFTRIDEVGVGQVVGFGNVAEAESVLVGNLGESVVGNDSVGLGRGSCAGWYNIV